MSNTIRVISTTYHVLVKVETLVYSDKLLLSVVFHLQSQHNDCFSTFNDCNTPIVQATRKNFSQAILDLLYRCYHYIPDTNRPHRIQTAPASSTTNELFRKGFYCEVKTAPLREVTRKVTRGAVSFLIKCN